MWQRVDMGGSPASAVFVLWSVSRSTAFFRSMRERSDLVALHEPLEGLVYTGPVEIGSSRFESPEALIDWLVDGPAASVFMKESLSPPVMKLVASDRRFLTAARHAFLIRDPVEIASSFLALEGDLRIHDTGVAALHELYETVRDAGGHRPVVIDSDDLVTNPEATIRAYCSAVGLPFVADALRWEAGVQPEWQRTARWHEDASASTCFFRPDRPDRHSLASHSEVRRFAARHQPFYEMLRSHRLRISATSLED